MIKLLKDMFKNFEAVQAELCKMGVLHFPTLYGWYTHVDKETFDLYIKKQKDENSEH